MQGARVLLVEDDDIIAEAVQAFLGREGIQVGRAADGLSGLDMALKGGWDLILLDVMLPGLDGFELCRHLQIERVRVPILFLTARGDEVSEVLGLGLGADDYISKPFSGVALAARVKAHLRRNRDPRSHTAPAERRVLTFGDLELDLSACTLRIEGASVSLTAKEFELLRHFAMNEGQVLTREQLFRAVWGEHYYEADDNTVTVHVRRLREKLEVDPADPRRIQTVRGLGYRFVGRI